MEKTLKIEGMMCGHCEMHVKKALEALDGVKKAEVSHKTGTAVVTLEKEFSILKSGGSLVSLRGLPNGEFAARMGMPTMKRFLFGLVGSRYDKMAEKNKQKYHFVFVREDGAGLKRISEIFGNRKIETSVDKIFELSEVNGALAKVAGGGSKGKTILKIS